MYCTMKTERTILSININFDVEGKKIQGTKKYLVTYDNEYSSVIEFLKSEGVAPSDIKALQSQGIILDCVKLWFTSTTSK